MKVNRNPLLKMYNIVMAVTAGWGSTPNCIEGIQYTYKLHKYYNCIHVHIIIRISRFSFEIPRIMWSCFSLPSCFSKFWCACTSKARVDGSGKQWWLGFAELEVVMWRSFGWQKRCLVSFTMVSSLHRKSTFVWSICFCLFILFCPMILSKSYSPNISVST